MPGIPVETVLRKYLWGVDLVVIAICAMFCARATATPIESAWRGASPAAVAAASAPAAAPRDAPQTYTKEVEPILKRNIFCSTCPPIIGRSPKDGTGPPPPPPLQKTTCRSSCWRSCTRRRRPTRAGRWRSSATTTSKTAGPYAVGAKIREATIDDIEDDRVYLDFGGGRREYLELVERAVPAAARRPWRPRRRPERSVLRRAGSRDQEDRRAHLRGAARRPSTSLLGNMGALARGARIVPETTRRQAGRLPPLQRPTRRAVREDRPSEQRRHLGDQRDRDEQPRPGADGLHEAQDARTTCRSRSNATARRSPRTTTSDDHTNDETNRTNDDTDAVRTGLVVLLAGVGSARGAVVVGDNGQTKGAATPARVDARGRDADPRCDAARGRGSSGHAARRAAHAAAKFPGLNLPLGKRRKGELRRRRPRRRPPAAAPAAAAPDVDRRHRLEPARRREGVQLLQEVPGRQADREVEPEAGHRARRSHLLDLVDHLPAVPAPGHHPGQQQEGHGRRARADHARGGLPPVPRRARLGRPDRGAVGKVPAHHRDRPRQERLASRSRRGRRHAGRRELRHPPGSRRELRRQRGGAGAGAPQERAGRRHRLRAAGGADHHRHRRERHPHAPHPAGDRPARHRREGLDRHHPQHRRQRDGPEAGRHLPGRADRRQERRGGSPPPPGGRPAGAGTSPPR